MEEIVSIIQTYIEDHPGVYITDDMIKGAIEENIELLIKEIKENL